MKREDFFSNKLGISDPVLLATLVSSTSLCNYDKKTILVSEGMVQECVPFLVSGMLRGFFTDESGREITDCFSYKPGDVALGSCTYGSPSLLSIEVLQDNTQLLLLPVSGAESVVRSSVESIGATKAVTGCGERLICRPRAAAIPSPTFRQARSIRTPCCGR